MTHPATVLDLLLNLTACHVTPVSLSRQDLLASLLVPLPGPIGTPEWSSFLNLYIAAGGRSDHPNVHCSQWELLHILQNLGNISLYDVFNC